jgi:ABC-type uncharacterized transport system permease subunit
VRVLTLDGVAHWARGADLLALAALAWAVFVPRGVFSTGVLAGCLIGSAVATAVLVHAATMPTPTQLMGGTGPEPVVGLTGARGEARLRPRGERTP